jgi:hypothetical protein
VEIIKVKSLSSTKIGGFYTSNPKCEKFLKIYVNISACIRTHAHILACMRIYSHILACMRIHAHILAYTHINEHILACMYINSHVKLQNPSNIVKFHTVEHLKGDKLLRKSENPFSDGYQN